MLEDVWAGEALELGWADVAFLFPKGIEDADQGGALPGKIVKVEQLKASHARVRRADSLTTGTARAAM